MTEIILPVFTNAITLEQVMAANAETIYYGAHTPWWTHDSGHVGSTNDFPELFEGVRQAVNAGRAPGAPQIEPRGLPCDPRGGVLFMADVTPWMKSAASNPDHYGKHRMRAFMAAHHLNCQTPDGRAWCMRGWKPYNEMLDRYDA